MYMQYWQMMQQQQQSQPQGVYPPQSVQLQEPVTQVAAAAPQAPPPQTATPSLLPTPVTLTITPPTGGETPAPTASASAPTPAPIPAAVDYSLTDMSVPRNVETLNAQLWEELNAQNYATQQIRLP